MIISARRYCKLEKITVRVQAEYFLITLAYDVEHSRRRREQTEKWKNRSRRSGEEERCRRKVRRRVRNRSTRVEMWSRKEKE